MPLPMSPEQLARFQQSDLFGHDVYEHRLLDGSPGFTDKPHCMYYYYLGFRDSKLPDVRHYYHDNGTNPIEYLETPTLIEKLTANALRRDGIPPPVGNGFLNLIWRRKSYLAFVMDSEMFQFIRERALHFEEKDNGTPNHSFFDGGDYSFLAPLPGGGAKQMTAFYCINHMKSDEAGTDIPDGVSQPFSFSLIFSVGNLPGPWTYDPGGINTGPAVAPPP